MFVKVVSDMKKILAVMCFSLALYTGLNMAFADEPAYRYQNVTVCSGDTMWDIASRWSDDKEDVRQVVYRICEANGLSSKHVYPGQVLKVPVRVDSNMDIMLAAK